MTKKNTILFVALAIWASLSASAQSTCEEGAADCTTTQAPDTDDLEDVCAESRAGENCDRCSNVDLSLESNCTECHDPKLDPNSDCELCVEDEHLIPPDCTTCKAWMYWNGTESKCVYCHWCDSSSARLQAPFCNPESGFCTCKYELTGPGCSQCVNEKLDPSGDCKTCIEDEHLMHPDCLICDSGYFWDTTHEKCAECVDCLIHEGNIEAPFCDPANGRCKCVLGYSGALCSDCATLYFLNTTTDDCEACPCSVPGSTACDSSGSKCECKNGYVGINCAECSPKFYSVENLCVPCDCNWNGTASCNYTNGECICRDGAAGTTCSELKCAGNHFPSGDTCLNCACSWAGSESEECAEQNGQCQCKAGHAGRTCDLCMDGWWLSTTGSCQECNCSVAGSQYESCFNMTGQCQCKNGYTGRTCQTCEYGFWLSEQDPTSTMSVGDCMACNCSPIGSKSASCDNSTGECKCRDGYTGRTCQECEAGYWAPQSDSMNQISRGECIECNCFSSGSITQECNPLNGNCFCKPGYANNKCSDCAIGYFRPTNEGTCHKKETHCEPGFYINDNFYCQQCPALTFSTGGSYTACQPCMCEQTGGQTIGCNQTTGECLCAPQFAGPGCAHSQVSCLSLSEKPPKCTYCSDPIKVPPGCWQNYSCDFDVIETFTGKMCARESFDFATDNGKGGGCECGMPEFVAGDMDNIIRGRNDQKRPDPHRRRRNGWGRRRRRNNPDWAIRGRNCGKDVKNYPVCLCDGGFPVGNNTISPVHPMVHAGPWESCGGHGGHFYCPAPDVHNPSTLPPRCHSWKCQICTLARPVELKPLLFLNSPAPTALPHPPSPGAFSSPGAFAQPQPSVRITRRGLTLSIVIILFGANLLCALLPHPGM